MGHIIQGRILIKVFQYSPSKDCHPVQLLEKLREAVTRFFFKRGNYSRGDTNQGNTVLQYLPSKDCHPVQLLEKLKEAVAGQKLNYHLENLSVLNTTLLTMQM